MVFKNLLKPGDKVYVKSMYINKNDPNLEFYDQDLVKIKPPFYFTGGLATVSEILQNNNFYIKEIPFVIFNWDYLYLYQEELRELYKDQKPEIINNPEEYFADYFEKKFNLKTGKFIFINGQIRQIKFIHPYVVFIGEKTPYIELEGESEDDKGTMYNWDAFEKDHEKWKRDNNPKIKDLV